jgi:glycosyltransferase involved in cell wall biosynthesis
MIRISVIICTYNRSESLKKTLSSLGGLSGLDSIDWELLVVDNNSSDGTREVVEEFISASGRNCRYLFEKKQGLSQARNRGIREAEGEVIAFTDDDVLLDPKWLTNLAEEFENDGVACVGGKILPSWEKPRPGWLEGDLLNILALLDLGEEKIRLSEPVIWGANLAIRSSMFRQYGGFDTNLGRTEGKLYAGEETKFIRMLLEKGETVLYCPSILVHHCIPEFRMKKSYFRKWSFDKGELKGKMMGDYQQKNLIGIPHHVLYETVQSSWKYLWRQVASPRLAFHEQLVLVHCLGFIAGRLRYRNTQAAPV